MLQYLAILLSTFYFFGSMVLPKGDFSELPYMADMYQHCKATEDKDMTPLDFVTDHLWNIDCLFESHADDDEKPHVPIQFHSSLQQLIFVQSLKTIDNIKLIAIKNNIYFIVNTNATCNGFRNNVFRPPIW